MRKTKERGSFHTFTEAKRDLSSSKKEVNDTESFTTEQCAQALLSAARAQGTDSPTTTTHFQNRASFIDSCTKIPKVGASLILQWGWLIKYGSNSTAFGELLLLWAKQGPWQSSWDKENAITPWAQPAQPWLPALAARLREHHAGVLCLKRSEGKARDCANRAGQQQERSPTASRT